MQYEFEQKHILKCDFTSQFGIILCITLNIESDLRDKSENTHHMSNNEKYKMPRTLVITIALSTFMHASSIGAAADTLVCDDPAQIMDTRSDLYLMQQIFNASSASKRLFSEIHYYDPQDPHLTIGMGHWIRGNIADLFFRFRSEKETWNDITRTWAQNLTATHWRQFRRETGIAATGQSALSAGIDQVLCASTPTRSCVKNQLIPWTKKVGEKFNTNEKQIRKQEYGHWFTAGWMRISRKESIARIQALHWSNTVLMTGVKDAEARGIHTRGGIASIISARSSGLRATMFKIGAKKAKAKFGSVSRTWSLEKVPSTAHPKNKAALEEDRLLQDWRAVVAWQYYTIKKGKKGRVRSRMRAIWKAFYEPSWGALEDPSSLSKSTDIPRHRGRPMDTSKFDFTVVFAGNPSNCS